MTRAGALTPSIATNRKARPTAGALTDPGPMGFLIFEDNSGGYHWTIVAGTGDTLVQSNSFASYEEAKQAARVVHDGAASAPFEPLVGEGGP
jgi:uncharacterized protein YegP (UPF0339 family)